MNNGIILNYITFIYFLAFLAYLLMMCFDKKIFGKAATVITVIGFIGHTAGLILRWIESYQLGIGHAPLSNLYESLIFFSWTIILLYLLVEWRVGNKSIGAFVTPLAFLAMAYSSFSNDAIEPLIPALQSNWLTSHVITCFVGYAAFALSFGLSYMYIIRGLNRLNPFSIKGRLSRSKYSDLCTILLINMIFLFLIYFFVIKDIQIADIHLNIINYNSLLAAIALDLFYTCVIVTVLIFICQSIRRMHDVGKKGFSLLIPVYNCFLLFSKGNEEENNYGIPDKYYNDSRSRLLKIFPNHAILEELSYQMVVIGFLMLTLGIITGAVWANSAWGTYWSWDPKETWSLITWFIYAAMLHSRLVSGWRGKKMALFSIVGFFCVIFTYLGVNLLLSGLHSYGSA